MNGIDVRFAPVFDGCAHISHGFFTRKGGVSQGLYAGLNTGPGSHDRPEHVRENRHRVASAMGTTDGRLLTNHQCHTTRVVTVDKPFLGPPPRADGLVSKTPGLALAALAADCAPVLFADPQAGVIGAAHAGWRGALAGVTDTTITAMCGLGARKSRIRAAIGPCISQENYEVGPDFVAAFIAESLANGRFFKPGQGEKSQFDLKGYLLARLRKAGIKRPHALPDCTYGRPDLYYSYRYNTHQGVRDYGRNISVIILHQ